jgi:hypothetical protein
VFIECVKINELQCGWTASLAKLKTKREMMCEAFLFLTKCRNGTDCGITQTRLVQPLEAANCSLALKEGKLTKRNIP